MQFETKCYAYQDNNSWSLLALLTSLLLMAGCGEIKIETAELNCAFGEEFDALIWNDEKWKSGAIIKSQVDSDNQLAVASQWSADSLFIYFRVVDNCLRVLQTEQDHPKLFLDDMVEVLFDPFMDRDSCWASDDIVYHINLWGVKKDDRGSDRCKTDPTWNGTARIEVQPFGTVNDTTDIDKGFIVGLAVPWTELGLNPSEGLRLGINFANGDNDGNGRQLFDWVGAQPMRSPYAFGDLVMTGTESL